MKDCGSFNITVRHSHMEKITTGNANGDGWRQVADPETPHRVQVLIDIEGIARTLGHRAVNSKRGVSKYIGGLVKVIELREVRK